MKKLGTRKIDEFGRVSIPNDIRKTMGIKNGDYMEFFFDISGGAIMMKQYNDSCLFCGSDKKLKNFDTKIICAECIRRISLLE